MAKNKVQFDFERLSDIVERLDKAGADLEKILTEVLEDSAEQIALDTIDALSDAYLPAGGRHSTGQTKASIVRNPKVEKTGTMLEVGIGFDKTKVGAGGWLITGTPKMAPDKKLADIYTNKKYENKLMKEIESKLEDELEKIVGG
ncbi:MAG: hypothetical protein IIY21_02055 [Clostridiales bacterium]|nr:hypothetical protein [Clostridiales bacterium]MBQ1572778.1 hypothetical protein [Clostridiales bacterium]